MATTIMQWPANAFTPSTNLTTTSAVFSTSATTLLPMITFDDTADNGMVTPASVMNAVYDSGANMTLKVGFYVSSPSTNTVTWEVSFWQMAEDEGSILATGGGFDTAISVSQATTATAGDVWIAEDTTVASADADGIVAGDIFILRIVRQNSDTHTGDAHLLWVALEQ